MSDKVVDPEEREKLRDLHNELKLLRARLPEMMQTLATPRDNQSSLELFHTVAKDATTLKREAMAFQEKFRAMEPTLERLRAYNSQKSQQETSHSSQHPLTPQPTSSSVMPDMPEMPGIPAGLDYGLDFDDMGNDFLTT